jgi:hypothetical protein
MRLSTCSAVMAALIVAIGAALLTGCGKPRKVTVRRPTGVPTARPAAPASRPAAPASRPGVAASRPGAAASRPGAASRPAATQESNACCLLGLQMPVHPFMLFGKSDVANIARRKGRDPLMQECWDRLVEAADKPDDLDDWYGQLEARAFIAQIADDRNMARRAIQLMGAVLRKADPDQLYEIRAANVELHGAPLRSLALAWDWLYEYMTPPQRGEILPGLEHWCRSCLTSTNKRWWRDASHDVGAIPIGGLGILALAIHGDSAHPDAALWLREATRRIGQNYLTTTWKPSGICYEGPNYASVGLAYPAVFCEALRRAGGADIVGDAGATLAMQYLTYQWMPEDGCAPIGDNTSFGGRTFAAEYLLGLGRSHDAVGLWTWRNNTDPRYIDPLIAYLWYPLDLHPVNPVAAETPTGRYFEVTPNRAGYFFSRTCWANPDAAFFAFVTRYERCNHQHYDMNSFLLGAYGTLFATHETLFPYGHENHGVDFEHNLIIIDEGGWPRHDSDSSCADDDSTGGLLVGLATGPFADYVRGDAKWSYRDNSVIIDNPAIRAERTFLFVKAGATPYVLAFDDNQFSDEPHTYRWQWYAPYGIEHSGAGTLTDPLVLTATRGSCAIHFVTPEIPVISTDKVPNLANKQRSKGLDRITVTQQGIRVRYAAIATLQETPAARPAVRATPVVCESESAGAAQIQLADGHVDQIAWQSEEMCQQRGSPLSSGPLATDGLLAMVRVKDGRVAGYVLGEGTYLRWDAEMLVQASDSVCVTADADGVKVFGRRQSRKGLPTLEPQGVKTYTPASR